MSDGQRTDLLPYTSLIEELIGHKTDGAAKNTAQITIKDFVRQIITSGALAERLAALGAASGDPIAIGEIEGIISRITETALAVRPNLTTEDLDTVSATGLYRQELDANATAARHYPDNRAGILEVVNIKSLVTQVYTTWYGKRYWRTRYGTYAWQEWNEIAPISSALTVRPNLTTEDLDTVSATGLYRQELDANATAARHYPDNRAGILEVVNIKSLVTQVYTTWYGKRYWRTRYGTYAWLAWCEFAKIGDWHQPYRGKKIAWFGDSIVEGSRYPDKVGSRLGANVLTFGFSSCAMAEYASSPLGYDRMSMYRIAPAIATGDFTDLRAAAAWLRDNKSDDNTPQIEEMASTDWETVDYIVIAFGTNDWAGPTPLGGALDPDPAGKSFTGALAFVIETIQKAHPHIQIMLLGMTWRTRWFSQNPEENSSTSTDIQGKYLVDYQDALISAGRKYCIPVCDIYRTSGINSMTYGHYLHDGVHPNANGVELITRKATGFLLSC